MINGFSKCPQCMGTGTMYGGMPCTACQEATTPQIRETNDKEVLQCMESTLCDMLFFINSVRLSNSNNERISLQALQIAEYLRASRKLLVESLIPLYK